MQDFRIGDIIRHRESNINFKIMGLNATVLARVNGSGHVDERFNRQGADLNHDDYQIICHPAEEYQAYLRGYKDGTSGMARRPGHFDHKLEWIRWSYLAGYKDGGIAKTKAMNKWCKSIGYYPSILREEDGK